MYVYINRLKIKNLPERELKLFSDSDFLRKRDIECVYRKSKLPEEGEWRKEVDTCQKLERYFLIGLGFFIYGLDSRIA